MPFYVISHKDSLTPSQCDELAAAITSIHTILFTTPSLFVNVKFEDASAAPYYVGGKRTSVNTIHANVRTGPSRLRSAYDELCRNLRATWEKIVPTSVVLHAIFVHGSLIAGEEQGFIRPAAGHDAEWVQENMAEFERRAAQGSEDMMALVEECKTRGLGV